MESQKGFSLNATKEKSFREGEREGERESDGERERERERERRKKKEIVTRMAWGPKKIFLAPLL